MSPTSASKYGIRVVWSCFLMIVVCGGFILHDCSVVRFRSSIGKGTLAKLREDTDEPLSVQRHVRSEKMFDLCRVALLSYALFPAAVQDVSAAGLLPQKPSNLGAIGYEAAESAYAPLQKLYSTPLLPQSAILNTLPLDNRLVGQLQAFLESYVQLINPTPRQLQQLATTNSALWTNLRINAQRAAGMLFYNQKQLYPLVDPNEPIDLQHLRQQLAERSLEDFKQQAIRLVTVSKRSNIGASLRCVRNALNSLCYLAYLQTPLRRPVIDVNANLNLTMVNRIDQNAKLKEQTDHLPRLAGRALVSLTFERPGPMQRTLLASQRETIVPVNVSLASDDIKVNDSIRLANIEGLNDGPASAEVVLLVDGTNYPLTAGNFIDLCQKGFYNYLPVTVKSIHEGGESVASMKVLGSYEKGYTEPITNSRRRIPLEVHREDEQRRRFTVFGAARNTGVFTRAKPVLSFATVCALV